MTRNNFIEQLRRQIYNGFPPDDAEITPNLVNQYLNQAIGVAAKQNYKDNIQLEGVGFVNNSFHTTFKGLSIVPDEQFQWKITLPEIPVGIGSSEGVPRVMFKDSESNLSYPGIPLSEAQVGYVRDMRPMPNKVLIYTEGGFCYALTTILMNTYTATVTMVSGGDSTDLGSTLNVPSDYFPVMIQFIQQQLILEKKMPKDLQNDGSDN